MLNYRACFAFTIEVIPCIVRGWSAILKVRQSRWNFQIHRARGALRQGSKLGTRRKNSSRASFRYSLRFSSLRFRGCFPFFLAVVSVSSVQFLRVATESRSRKPREKSPIKRLSGERETHPHLSFNCNSVTLTFFPPRTNETLKIEFRGTRKTSRDEVLEENTSSLKNCIIFETQMR